MEDFGIVNIGCQAHRFSILASDISKVYCEDIDSAKNIIQLFRRKTIPKNCLLKLANSSLVLPSECRFMSWLIVINRIIKLKKHLIDSIQLSDFLKWKNEANKETKKQMIKS